MARSFSDAIPRDPQNDIWDVVVVGTGAGGGTAGFELARLGHSVLFLERGRATGRDPTVVRGPTNARPRVRWNGDTALRHGWWPARIHERVRDVEYERLSPFGCGMGGTTALFSMFMERLRPGDFNPGRFFSAVDSTLPDTWPISYQELEPFYVEAEALYRVRGTVDPIGPIAGKFLPPHPPSEMEMLLLRDLACSSLHPYRIHYACERVPHCTGCFASLCPHRCRNDSGRTCVEPALIEHGAQILPSCQVQRLDVQARVVRSAICHWNGIEVSIRGKVFILAANAFFTPALLQRSATALFPDGLANSSAMVGRNLMFHASDFMLVCPRKPPEFSGRMTHGISLNDFYLQETTKLGNIHAHATYGPTDKDAPVSTVFATIVEDLPYPGNRVSARAGACDDVTWEYVRPAELQHRSQLLIQRFSEAVSAHLTITAPQSAGAANLAHACGTCRFGSDPRTSVLDRNNRAHDVDNLYVVDASFFPSSGAMPPSLTIAANSLRIARQISLRI
jgi:choline dehydrogenase-like flavoprotein